MNKLLAESIRVFNGFFAVILILVGVAIGAAAGRDSFSMGLAGGITGGILGFLAAVLFCGALALFIDIRNELVAIRAALERSPVR